MCVCVCESLHNHTCLHLYISLCETTVTFKVYHAMEAAPAWLPRFQYLQSALAGLAKTRHSVGEEVPSENFTMYPVLCISPTLIANSHHASQSHDRLRD